MKQQNMKSESKQNAFVLPTEKEMREWIDTLTVDSVRRAVEAAEAVGYQQVDVQLMAENLAFDADKMPIVHMPNDNRPYIRASVNGTLAYPLMDSGAMVCVVSYTHEHELEKFNCKILPCSMTVTTVTKSKHQVTGVMWLNYEISGRHACIPTVVMKSHKSYFIAGINFFEAFDIQFAWGDTCKYTPIAKPLNERKPPPTAQNMPSEIGQNVEVTCMEVVPDKNDQSDPGDFANLK